LALITSGGVVFAQFALFLLLGVLLFVYNQQLLAQGAAPLLDAGGDKDRIFPEFVVREMPRGVAGLVIAAIFAAAMSNLSGALNSLASSSIIDFQKIRGMAADPAKLVSLSRWMTVGWGIVLMLLGTIEWGGVLEKGLTIASIVYQSLLGLFLLGILNKRATARGALIGMFAGLALMLYLWARTPLAWTWYVLVGTVVTFAVGSVASVLAEQRMKPQMNTDEHT
jgi:Na+/proline symporter